MNYEQMQDMKDLLEQCYVKISTKESDLLLNIKKTIIKLKEDMNEMDAYMSYIEQKVEEVKYGSLD